MLVRRCLRRWPCLISIPTMSLLRSLLHYLPLFHVIHYRSFSTFSIRIISSLCVVLHYTDCSALIWSTLILLLSALIFSLHFSFLFCHGFSLCVWCSCSDPICHVFLPLAFTPLWSNLIIPLGSVCSNLFFHIFYAQLWLLWSCANLLAPICLDQIAQILSVFRSSGPSNFSKINSTLRYTSPSPSI